VASWKSDFPFFNGALSFGSFGGHGIRPALLVSMAAVSFGKRVVFGFARRLASDDRRCQSPRTHNRQGRFDCPRFGVSKTCQK
jgi:hypothetical protein